MMHLTIFPRQFPTKCRHHRHRPPLLAHFEFVRKYLKIYPIGYNSKRCQQRMELKLRWPFGTALRAAASISHKFH